MFSSISEKSFWLVIFIIEGVIIIWCNILGVIIFMKRSRHSRPCLLLVNQCVADILVGIAEIYYICITYNTNIGVVHFKDMHVMSESQGCSNISHVISTLVWLLALGESFHTLTLMALERAYAVLKPFKHRVLRKKTYFWTIITTWIVMIIQCFLVTFSSCIQPNITFLDGAFVIVYAVAFVSAFCLISSYLAIYIKLRFFPIFQNTSHIRNEYKLCRTFFYASVASVLLCMPFSFALLYERVKCSDQSTCAPHYIHYLTRVVIFSNAFVNFFVYAWRFPGFVGCIKKLLCCEREVENHAGQVVAVNFKHR